MLNLDTHILIYALSNLEKLSDKEKNALSVHRWSISAIVLWEITKLFQKGRITIDTNSADFHQALSQIHVWPIDLSICSAVQKLDFHSDPADELIAATSLAQRIPLLTHDSKIRKSKKVPLLKL